MKKLFSLDLRSLALFRISLALIFLYDIAVRFGHREVFYTDDGVLSRVTYIDMLQLPWKFTLLTLNGSIEFVNLLLAIGIIAGVMFLLGIRTKIAGMICWILLMTFHERHPLISHGGDNLLRLLFFWGHFLPLNAKFSFDSILSKSEAPKSNLISSIFTFSYIMQVCFVYIFTSLYKLDPSWTKDFTAVYYTLHLDIFAKPLGIWISQFDIVTKFLTAMTMLIESFGVLLLFIPIKNHIFRMNAIILFIGLHFSIWMTMQLGVFAPACIAAWLALLPSEFWDILLSNAKSKMKSAIIYYDRDCGFCYKIAHLLRMFMGILNSEIKPAQSHPHIFKIMDEQNSWVLSLNGKEHTKFDAILELVKISPIRLTFLPLFILKPIGNYLYDVVAANRDWCGRTLNALGSSQVRLEGGWLLKSLNALLIVTVFAWNIEGYVGHKRFDVQSPWTEIVFSLQLNQQWNMFAPYPMTDDGWYIIEAKFLDDSTYDILNDKPFDVEKPKNVAVTYGDSSWQKYMMNLWLAENIKHRVLFGNFLCRKWNRENYHKIKSFKLYFMHEPTPPMGYPVPEPAQTLLHEGNCFN